MNTVTLKDEQVKLLETVSADLRVPLEEVVGTLFANLTTLRSEWPDSFRMLVTP